MEHWEFYLSLILACIIVQGVYAMLEMASVSFNKVRLQYYVSKDNRRAIWLSYLLNHPAQLFGTTLIAVTTALQLGSESARRFYESLGLNPDWAPLSQFFLVLIFAEISPLLAGRRYAEHVIMLGVPILYFTSILLRPIIWLLDLLCRLVNKLVGSPTAAGLYLSREELQKMIEEREVTHPKAEGEEFNTVASNIFTLKNKSAKELMTPLKDVQMVAASCTLKEMRDLLAKSYTPFLPIYQRTREHIVAIAYPRDLLRLAEIKRVREHARNPWFITENSSILQILRQFRRNNESVSVVLNEAGSAVGILTLDDIIDEIFGRSDTWVSLAEPPEQHRILIERTFPGDMKIEDFNQQYNAHLEAKDAETFEELMTQELGHIPMEGESVRVGEFELSVVEATLLGAKTISIRSL